MANPVTITAHQKSALFTPPSYHSDPLTERALMSLTLSLALGSARGVAGDAAASSPSTTNVVFGSLTRAGIAGDHRAGVATTAASITSGDSLGYFQVLTVSGQNWLCVSAAGDTADIGGSGSVYLLTMSNGDVFSVTVQGSCWSCATQTEWDFLIAQATATLQGKTIRVRRLPAGVAYTSGVDGSAARLRRADYSDGTNPLTIQGDDISIIPDGGDAAAVSSYPIFDKFVVRGGSNITFRYIDTPEDHNVKFSLIGESANHCNGLTIDHCRVRGERLDPNGDFHLGVGSGASQYPNAHGIVVSGTASWIGTLVLTNNHITWSDRAIVAAVGGGTITTSGNRIQYFYDDGINISYGGADQLWTCEDNVISHPLGRSDDATDPHVDFIRGAGTNTAATDWTVKIRRNRMWRGGARGTYQFILLSDFKSAGVDSGKFYVAEVTGNLCVGDVTVGIQIENAKNCIVLNNTMVADALSPVGTPSIKAGQGTTDATTSGTHTVRRNVADAFGIAGSPTLDNNVTTGKGGVSISYASAFVGNGLSTWAPETLAEIMAWFSVKPSGPLDIVGTYDVGAVGSGAVTWSSTVPGNDGHSVTELTPTTGDPLSLTVLDTTTVNTIDGNGWAGEIVFKGMAASQLLDGTKVVLTVQGFGFDATGAATTPSRTVTGTAHLRKPLPQTYAVGLNLTVGDRVVSKAKVSGSTRIYQVTAGTATTVDVTGPVNTSSTSVIDTLTYQYVGSVTDNSAVVNDNTRTYPYTQFATAVSGSDAKAYVVFDQYIYTGETITAATIYAGAYGGSSNASLTGILSLANSSTRALPKPFCAWTVMPWQIVSGTTLHVEATASTTSGQQGRMLACMKFRVYTSGGVDTGLTTTVTTMTASTTLTSGRSVPVFRAEIDISSLADGLYNVRLEAYPFFGASWKSATDGFGVASPTITDVMTINTQKAIPFRKDAAGTFGRIYAYMDPAGNDGTGVASATAGTAAAAPFATAIAAMSAIQTLSNSSLSRNNCGNHEIRLKAGTYTTASFGGSTLPARAMGDVWVTMTRDPATSSAADVILQSSATSVNRQCAKRMKFSEITLTVVATNAVIDNIAAASLGNFAAEVWFDKCVFPDASNNKPFTRVGLVWLTNCTLTKYGTVANENARQGIALLGGCTLVGPGGGSVSNIAALHYLGNNWSAGAVPYQMIPAFWAEGTGIQTNADVTLFMANSFPSCRGAVRLPNVQMTRGFAVVQNLLELYTSSGASVKGGEYAADGVNIACSEIHYIFNTVAGDGYNIAYNDGVSAVTDHPAKTAIELFNFSADRNSKGSWYDGSQANGARISNIATRYKVGARGNVVYGFGSFDNVPSPKNLAGEVKESRAVMSGAIGFTADRSLSGSPTTGAGDYRPTTTSSARAIVGATEQFLPFDLNGTTRKTDGTGAAGALEWA